tara:strand:- start:58 stop:294 length:237 start_codon:yes stop_codon:yes gene_type:complete
MRIIGGVSTPFFQTHEERQAEIRKYNPFCNICYGQKASHDAQVRDGDVRPHEYLEEGGFYSDIDGNRIKVPPRPKKEQ